MDAGLLGCGWDLWHKIVVVYNSPQADGGPTLKPRTPDQNILRGGLWTTGHLSQDKGASSWRRVRQYTTVNPRVPRRVYGTRPPRKCASLLKKRIAHATEWSTAKHIVNAIISTYICQQPCFWLRICLKPSIVSSIGDTKGYYEFCILGTPSYVDAIQNIPNIKIYR